MGMLLGGEERREERMGGREGGRQGRVGGSQVGMQGRKLLLAVENLFLLCLYFVHLWEKIIRNLHLFRKIMIEIQ